MRLLRLRPGDESRLVDVAREFRRHALSCEGATAVLANPCEVVLVALRVERPVAYAHATILMRLDAEALTLLLRDVEVMLPPARRAGLARILIEELKRIADRHRVPRIVAPALERNAPFVTLLRTAGFERPAVDEAVLEFALQPRPRTPSSGTHDIRSIRRTPPSAVDLGEVEEE